MSIIIVQWNLRNPNLLTHAKYNYFSFFPKMRLFNVKPSQKVCIIPKKNKNKMGVSKKVLSAIE